MESKMTNNKFTNHEMKFISTLRHIQKQLRMLTLKHKDT